MKQIQIKVPAKINLFLHVTGRRSDGYHLLESIFCPIDWYDDLTISICETPGITRTGGLPGLAQKDDLAVRAAHCLLDKLPLQTGVHIDLKKNIPSGAGLGGGSADAAYTLMAINELLQLNKTQQELATIGCTLGADVPFFLGNGPAFVSGIGDCIDAIALPEMAAVVIKPPASIPTVDIFRHPDLTREASSVKISVFGFSDSCGLPNFIANEGKNQLQPVAESVCKQVVEAVSLFQTLPHSHAAQWVRMSGSGSSVFGVFSNMLQARQAEVMLQQQREAQHSNQWLIKAVKTLPHANLKSQTVS
jgi:4-diphosphocytidyl-2-C-methyl-D-erythritol kinase